MLLTNYCKSAVRDLWLCISISVLSTTYGISLNIVTILPACVSNVHICIYCQMVKIIEDMCIIVSVHIWSPPPHKAWCGTNATVTLQL